MTKAGEYAALEKQLDALESQLKMGKYKPKWYITTDLTVTNDMRQAGLGNLDGYATEEDAKAAADIKHSERL